MTSHAVGGCVPGSSAGARGGEGRGGLRKGGGRRGERRKEKPWNGSV